MNTQAGARIKRRRQKLDMSAETLAEKVGVSPATIYRYENNDISHMGVDKLPPIAAALRTTPGQLMGWDDNAPASADSLAPDERELLTAYRGMNALGRSTALAAVRGLAGNPAMQEGATSSEMA